MSQAQPSPHLAYPKSRDTCRAFLWSSLLRTPFWAIFGMLPFILYKDLHATPLQIAALITIKPLVSLFSLYWSHHIHQRSDRLRANIRWATFLAYVPFFFIPWVSSPWYFVMASGIYMLFNRGVIPAWMELLKLNVPDPMRNRVFSVGSTFCHLGGGAFPFLIGWLLDDFVDVWRWILPATALFGSAAALLNRGLHAERNETQTPSMPPVWSWQLLASPWKRAWQVIKERPDFARFQLGFLLGGSGLMVIQPELPAFFVDVLGISYTELAVALTLCKGIGFAVTSPLWAFWMNRWDIYRFSAYVTFLAALFPVGLALATIHLAWLFVAYLLYGIMQAGSELSWNLSGTIFARHEDSSTFTGINVGMVGMRGCVAPPLGGMLGASLGPAAVLWAGALLCLGGMAALQYGRQRQVPVVAK